MNRPYSGRIPETKWGYLILFPRRGDKFRDRDLPYKTATSWQAEQLLGYHDYKLFSRRRRSGPSNREQRPFFACAHASLTGGAIRASGGEFAKSPALTTKHLYSPFGRLLLAHSGVFSGLGETQCFQAMHIAKRCFVARLLFFHGVGNFAISPLLSTK
jgi:hypothetical protein